MSERPSLYPTFLKLTGRKVVVIGGGRMAASKLENLLSAGAAVTVVAPEILPEIERSPVTILRRKFEAADLDGAWWVVAAAPAGVNQQVAAAAEERRVFVNAVDDPARASAYLGGVFRRGSVTAAISTEGRAPGLAGLLREGLEAVIPEEIEEWVEESQRQKKEWKAEGVPMERRRPLLLKALNELYDNRAAKAAGKESQR